ncbi:MAG: NCS2 family permease [Deltaproteobacteria bacterium]|nr:NCS2 family permease [Deltaproteobacteria bacterium]
MFKLKAHFTTPSVELSAGLATFLSMAYVMAVNPLILSEAGMPKDAVFTATVLAVIAATLIMCFVANLPFAVAPGMGLNAYFVSLVTGQGLTVSQALTAVFVSGVIFVALSLSPAREKVLREVPESMRIAVAAGIGIMIAHIGLFNSGILTPSPPLGQYTMGAITAGAPLLAVIGVLITGILLAMKVRFALLLGIILATLIGIPMGVTPIDSLQGGIVKLPPSISPIFVSFDFSALATGAFWGIVLALVFMEVFDGLAGFLGLFTVMGKQEAERYRYKLGKAFIADSIGVVAGAVLGTSPNTTYAESGAGVAQGGRTGLTALTVAILFALCLLISPLFLTIPPSAVASALVLVGLYMLSSIKDLKFDDITESFPAFVIIALIAFSLKLSDSMAVGWILYILMKLLAGRSKEVTATVWIVGALFLAKEIFG